MPRIPSVHLTTDWRSAGRKAFPTLHDLSTRDREILRRALLPDDASHSAAGLHWLAEHFPEVVPVLDPSRTRVDGADLTYEFLDAIDTLGHIDPDICPREASLCELVDLLLQGSDGGSVPEILLAPFLLATLKLAFGTVGVTVELYNSKSEKYDRLEKLRNRSAGAMAFPMLYPQKWERADTDRFIDFTIKVYDTNSYGLSDRVDVELQSRQYHGEPFRSPHYSEIRDGSETALNNADSKKYLALAEMEWPVDPLLITCGEVNEDPLAVAVDVVRHLAKRCTERWKVAIEDLP